MTASQWRGEAVTGGREHFCRNRGWNLSLLQDWQKTRETERQWDVPLSSSPLLCPHRDRETSVLSTSLSRSSQAGKRAPLVNCSRNIAGIWDYLSLDDAKTLFSQLDYCNAILSDLFSRLDYCIAILSGLPKKATDRLQLVKNAVWVLTKTKMREHITPVLASLHWLPVVFRID